MNTEEKIFKANIKSLLERLKKRTPTFYNYHYKVISTDKKRCVYIAVLNKFGDLAAVLAYRMDLLFLTNATPLYLSRLSGTYLRMCETIFKAESEE